MLLALMAIQDLPEPLVSLVLLEISEQQVLPVQSGLLVLSAQMAIQDQQELQV